MSVQHVVMCLSQRHFHVCYVVLACPNVISQVSLRLHFAPKNAIESSAGLEETHVLAAHAGITANGFG